MEAIKIDEDGRYVMVVENAEHVSLDHLEAIGDAINNWWLGSNKFFIVELTEGVKVKFERVDKDDKS